MSMIKFYDTSSLLLLEHLPTEFFIISSITIQELENIKDSNSKSEEIKAKARLISKELFAAAGYEIAWASPSAINWLKDNNIEINNDTKILASAFQYKATANTELTFITNDICLFNLAKLYFSNVEAIIIEQDNYTGYQEISLTNEELANFYLNKNAYSENLMLNEYLIIKDLKEEVYKKTSNGLEKVIYPTFRSDYFGTIKPRDEYQLAAMDSLSKNEITLLGGPPGSGKTFLALGYLFSLLERGKIDRIVVFCNPVVARNAAKLGYYPGSQLEKLLASQVGNVLASKLGGITEIERLVGENKLVLIPAGDARGYEVPPHSGVYILESQNLDIVLLKMLLQRIGEKCITIIDGDRKTQTDLLAYEGVNNGMERVSKVFRGSDIFGQVDLKTIYRSKISSIAENM